MSVAAVMGGLERDRFEIEDGMTESMLTASRAELDERFQQINRRT
ncbi:MAG TPA: hypothetical protein VG963_18915 [Polyangiaceae bacterium]|nr:hypothetical protein [Polyangiaceae bacterium]